MNQEKRTCQNCKQSFVIEPDDFGFYERMRVPAPTFCPACRTQRRMAFRNDGFLYKRKSDFSGESIFSMYSEKSPIKVYELEAWYSDKWDPISYGRDVDFSRPFFEQIREMFQEVPWRARGIIKPVGSEYSNNFTGFKNCYLCFNGSESEECGYSNGLDYSKNSFDNSHIAYCELAYEGFWLTRCNTIAFSSQCEDSFNIWFSKNLRGCSNCFGCANLTNKSFCIFNRQYTKEEYEKEIQKYNLGSRSAVKMLWQRAQKFWLQFPEKFMQGAKNSRVSGNYINQSKNVFESYLVRSGEDLKSCQYLQTGPNKDCRDLTFFVGNELVYEAAQCGDGAYNLKFCFQCWTNVKNLQYCTSCLSSSDCFGCSSLRNKQYCILNKQYTKEEYEKLVPKIIAHMNEMPYVDEKGRKYCYGEFFPAAFSPFAYNETIAQEYFPLTKDEAAEQGYAWKDQEAKGYSVTLPVEEIVDDIKFADESILNQVIECAHEGRCNDQCTKAFRIIPQELLFYKRMNLPIPDLCPNCRHFERLKRRNPIHLWHRACQCAGTKSENGVYTNTAAHQHGAGKCTNEFETSYSPDRPEIVYCEQCYQAEII